MAGEIWNPNDKQFLIYNGLQKYMDAMGDPRTGKSVAFMQKIRREVYLQPGIRILITRDTGTQLSTATYQQFLDTIAQDGDVIARKYTRPFNYILFKNGSEVLFIPFDEMDTTKAGSSEYGIIFMEEAHRSSLKQWTYFHRRLSQQWGNAIGTDGKPYRNKITYRGLWTARNPAGRGYLWQIFNRDRPLAKTGNDDKFLTVTFFLEDNLENLPQDYIDDIEDLPAHMRKRFQGANEDPEEGLVFPHFDRRIHVVEKPGWIPEHHYRVVGGQDQGYQTPTHFNWGCVTEEGFIIVFREYRRTMCTIPENARNILDMEAKLEESGMGQIDYAWIDPTTHMRDGKNASGLTTFEQYLSEGMAFLNLPARLHVKDRVDLTARALLPQRRMKIHPITKEFREEGWPKLMFTSDCEQTIREHEEWSWPSRNSTLKDPTGSPEEKNDHGPDATAYLLIGLGDDARSDEDPGIVRARESDPNFRTRRAVTERLKKADKRRDLAKRGNLFLR